MEFQEFIENLNIPPNPYAYMSDEAWIWLAIDEQHKEMFAKRFLGFEKEIDQWNEADKRSVSISFLYMAITGNQLKVSVRS